MPPKKEPTPEAYLLWLQEAAERLTIQQPWPKGATRFGYFQSEVCWSLIPRDDKHYDQLSFLVEDFESSYRDAHESGDIEAIFEFAKHNREALTRPWVLGNSPSGD